MQNQTLYWEDVVEGAELPAIGMEMSLLRLVAFVRATGLYDYIHFDRDYAQSVGMRDAFMATPQMGGLFSRLMTEWSGPHATIRSLSIAMRQQCCPGDMLAVTGKVGRKYRADDGAYLVDIVDLNIGHALAANAVGGSATMIFPSHDGGTARPGTAGAVVRPAPNAEMPEFAKAMIGVVKPSPQSATPPLTEHEISLWCEALEDWNPLYWNAEAAAKGPYGGIVAPPAMGWFYGAGMAANSGIGYLKPGTQLPEPVRQGLTGHSLLQALREGLIAQNTPFALPDFPEAAVTLAREDFFAPIRPGDSVHTTYEMLDCSPLKTTRIGQGYFITFVTACYNQREELVKTMTLSLFCYRP